ncbi:hypothetical protein D4764_20G0005250 [Takifugu flavidus]|uniref:Alkylated DNA repair protein AlkB homologue 8 N-terminal domain-containing protein n=1 Tax=Takifugu flavidus TaxID=433684 RepID=A0A5C6NH01_9TELE|nr:hypothetical protein D4764_20G0005250 [Takifugu flavidus]
MFSMNELSPHTTPPPSTPCQIDPPSPTPVLTHQESHLASPLQLIREVITNFVAWCELNHLRINASKTKEVVIDFSRKASHIAPVNIQGLDIEIAEEYKYLGVHLNNKLDWTRTQTPCTRRAKVVFIC